MAAFRPSTANSPRAVAASELSAAAGSNQGSNYDQLHRNIVIRADIYGGAFAEPSILAANYGFGGITAIPGLDSESEIELAVAAGAGVVVHSARAHHPTGDGRRHRTEQVEQQPL